MNPWCWCVILTFLANKSVIIYFFINTKRITCHFEFVFDVCNSIFYLNGKFFFLILFLWHVVHWTISFMENYIRLLHFEFPALAVPNCCVVVWYCKTKLNPGTENQRKPFHVVQKKKKEVILNFCTIPVCSVAWLRGPVFIFHLKISTTAISTLFWHQILKRLLNNLRRRKITLANFFFYNETS